MDKCAREIRIWCKLSLLVYIKMCFTVYACTFFLKNIFYFYEMLFTMPHTQFLSLIFKLNMHKIFYCISKTIKDYTLETDFVRRLMVLWKLPTALRKPSELYNVNILFVITSDWNIFVRPSEWSILYIFENTFFVGCANHAQLNFYLKPYIIHVHWFRVMISSLNLLNRPPCCSII